MTDRQDPHVECGAAAYQDVGERSQAVLWHILLEHEPHAEVATIIGCSAGEVAGLLDAACSQLRASLRARYDAFDVRSECAGVVPLLASYYDDALSSAVRDEIDSHLTVCDACTAALGWLRDATALMEQVVLPNVLGGEAAARYVEQRNAGDGHGR